MNASFLPFRLTITVILTQAAWAGSIVTNGNFTTGDFTGWNCPTSNCSTLHDDPYWMYVDTNFIAPGDEFAAHIGAWDANNPGFISQTLSGLSANSNYTLQFLYGEFNQYDSYSADPSLPQTNRIDAFWNGANIYSQADFFLDSNTAAGDGFFDIVTLTVNPGDSTTATLEFAAHDVLQDVILTDISITPANAGLSASSVVRREVVGSQWADSALAPTETPEPYTFGLVALSCAMLFAAANEAKRKESRK
jgi:hypothetical protein